MGKLEITLDTEHENMMKNLLTDYDGSQNQAISDIIAYYYNYVKAHPTIRVAHTKMDSYILDGLEMSEKDALLIRHLLISEKTKAEKELSYILYKEEDNTWWYGGSKVQADAACKVQYDSINTIERCNNIVKALDALIEQRERHDA